MINTTRFKLYIVMSIWGGEEHITKHVKDGIFDRLLFSYAYRHQFVQFLEWFDSATISNFEMLIDSGAFTVAASGGEVDLDEYIKFLKDCKTKGFKSLHAICLDAIPVDVTKECFDKCAEETFKNYQYMQQAGIDFVLPVYHAGEEMRWLDQIVESGCEYFAVGGVSGRIDTAKWKRWAFEAIFSRLKSLKYSGKVHMLGLATPRLLLQYPWYSADATFQKQTGFGRLHVFDPGTGQAKSFSISGLTLGGKAVRTKVEQEYILRCLNACGMSLKEWEELDDYWVRQECGFRSWRAFEKYVDDLRISGKVTWGTRRQIGMEDNFGE